MCAFKVHTGAPRSMYRCAFLISSFKGTHNVYKRTTQLIRIDSHWQYIYENAIRQLRSGCFHGMGKCEIFDSTLKALGYNKVY